MGGTPGPQVADARPSLFERARTWQAPRPALLYLRVEDLPGGRVLPWIVFAAYAVLLVVLASRHEPWFDEAQAWLLARDESVWELLAEQMRYEGSPPLWHLLLLVPAKLGLPYGSLQVLGAVAALAGAWLVVRFAPFPLLVKTLLVFSYTLAYQYAIVARSYCLVAPLLFLAARAYPRRATTVWPFAAPLVLLALVSTHGFLIAGSIATVHAWQLRRSWRTLPPETRSAHLHAGLAFVTIALAVVAMLLPPADLATAGANLSPGNWLRWAPRVLNSALAGYPPVSAAVVAASVWWFRRTRTLLLWALPTLALLTLSAVKYHNFWHDGLPFLVWVFAMWASFSEPVARRGATAVARWAALAALTTTLAINTWWWALSFRYDYAEPYSGSPALAAYLKETNLDDPDVEIFAAGFHTIGVLPYFDSNIFDNYNDGELPAYWFWTQVDELADRPFEIRQGRPDVIIWGVKFRHQQRIPVFRGYRVEQHFPGALYWKGRIIERDAFVLLRKT